MGALRNTLAGRQAGRAAPAGGPRWPASPGPLAAHLQLAKRGPDGVNVAGGTVYAATGAILLKTRLPARTSAPVTIDGDYVITAGSVAQSAGQRMFIVAYRLGATGTLPGSAGS